MTKQQFEERMKAALAVPGKKEADVRVITTRQPNTGDVAIYVQEDFLERLQA